MAPEYWHCFSASATTSERPGQAEPHYPLQDECSTASRTDQPSPSYPLLAAWCTPGSRSFDDPGPCCGSREWQWAHRPWQQGCLQTQNACTRYSSDLQQQGGTASAGLCMQTISSWQPVYIALSCYQHEERLSGPAYLASHLAHSHGCPIQGYGLREQCCTMCTVAAERQHGSSRQTLTEFCTAGNMSPPVRQARCQWDQAMSSQADDNTTEDGPCHDMPAHEKAANALY